MQEDKNMPAIIHQKQLPVVKNNDDLQKLVFAAFPADKFNVLFPVAINIDPKIKVQAHIVQTTPPTKGKYGYDYSKTKDWWAFKGAGDAIPTADLLRKISATVGVRWNPKECDVTHRKEDEKTGQIISLEFRAVGQILQASGVFKTVEGSYRYNYYDDMEDVQFKKYNWNEHTKKKEYTGEIDMDTINRRRRYALQLCETGAKKRALYDGLGILEKSFSPEDTFKPFVLPVVTDDYDYKDPIIRKAIADRAIGATAEMYGGAVDADYEVVTDEPPSAVIEPPPATEGQPPQAENEPPAQDVPPEQAQPSRREVYLQDMHDATSAERANEIVRLAAKSKTDLRKWAPPVGWGLATQMAWLDKLAVAAGEIEKG
jgi:hypothetical protein